MTGIARGAGVKRAGSGFQFLKYADIDHYIEKERLKVGDSVENVLKRGKEEIIFAN